MAGRRFLIVGVSALVAGFGVSVASAATPPRSSASVTSPTCACTAPYKCPDDYELSPDVHSGLQNGYKTVGAAVFAGEGYDVRAGACVKAAGKEQEEMLQTQWWAGYGAVLDSNGRATAGVYWDGGTQVCYIRGGTYVCNKP
ncbi:MAG: hypothetical protein ACJ735_17670 [Actinomycetes bacterium]